MIVWFISLIVTIIFVIFKNKKSKVFKFDLISVFIVLLHIFLFKPTLSWLELLKSPRITMWDSLLFEWCAKVIFFIFLLNLVVILGKNTFNYMVTWFFRLFIWLNIIYWVWKYWFFEWDWGYSESVMAKWSVIFIWIIFIIEWVLLLVSYLIRSPIKK